MINIAILGFGVVGGGVADLLTENARETYRLGGDEINIKYVLDLRDFPDSPFGDRVIHDYSVIANDPEIDVVIETMGGSHPAYEYTMAALRAGKSVITSNKEVVANFGDEFLALAKEMGVAYRFEAAVGGGIPVISPLISCVCQNKITEVTGILNGTTNFILTEMKTAGKSFDEALADAQKRGYAEANPAADIEGTDAARKITILAAIVTGKLLPVSEMHVEGITGIRSEDVAFAESIGGMIKLLGRAVITDGEPNLLVAPFIVKATSQIKNVMGVFNAVTVRGEPLGEVMFYGAGAGAGATASAVVGDLMQIMTTKNNYPAPVFTKCDTARDFKDFVSSHYLALNKTQANKLIEAIGGYSSVIGEEYAVVTEPISERELDSLLSKLDIKPIANIRIYG